MTSALALVQRGDLRMLSVLLRVPQTVPQKDLHQALLHAAKHGLCECAEHLLNAGVDVDIEDASGNTSLHHSINGKHLDVIRLLLERGASPNRKGASRNYPLHMAAKRDMDNIMLELIKHKANINACDSAGQTPLIAATRELRFAAIVVLVESGCHLDCQDNQGRTALHYACQLGTGVEVLLTAGANPDICDKTNCTPLLLAATEGFSHVVKLLCKANCNPNITNSSARKTPLHILAFKGHPECLPDLLCAGADVNLRDAESRTPLWYAVDNGRDEVVKLLLMANSLVDSYQCPPSLPRQACPVKLALDRRNVCVLKMFIVTGFDTQHLRECLQENVLCRDLTDSLSYWLQHAHDVMTLKQLCRRWIRHHEGTRLMHDITSLPLPSGLRDFLLLKELNDVHVS